MQNQENNDKMSFMNVLMMYLGMFIIATALIIWWQKNYHELFILEPNIQLFKDYLMIIGLGTGLLLCGNYLFYSWVPQFKKMQNQVMVLMNQFNTWQIILASILASIAEEMLFRGVMLPATGLIGSSLLFALIHIGFDAKAFVWMFWAFCCGLVMGAVTLHFKVLYPAIVLHCIYNFCITIYMIYKWKNMSHQEQLAIAKTMEVEDLE